MTVPTFADVEAAARRIRPFVHRTPVARSSTLDAELGADVFFKCENLQKVGAFKARGAVNAVLSLSDAVAERGVVTHSSGNHAQALAYAASVRQIPCTVVMPDDAPAVKRRAVEGYGAKVIVCPRPEREAMAASVTADTGAAFVHPYDDPLVVAGQGTAALELVEQVPDLDVVVAPIGGGGLLSGTTIAATSLRPGVQIVGAEPAAVDDAARSLATGVRQPPVDQPDTIADGLLTGIGEIAFSVLSSAGVRITTVTDAEIVAAARFHLERMKLVVEPSGATALAALRRLRLDGRRVGAIVSGGNTDFSWLER